MRKYNRKKDDEKFNRDNEKFQKRALCEDHPQACPICLVREKTHLVYDCGNQNRPWHRYHGYCEEDAALVVGRGICALCNLPVSGSIHVGTAFFVGHG